MTRLVVVGNGMAGARVVEEVLRRDPAGRLRIAVFGEEPHGNYNRILLSAVLAGQHGLEDIMTHPPDWYAARGVRLHAGVRAERVDRAAQLVRCAGVVEPYDTLVLATGSRPFVPPMAGLRLPDGAPKPGVFAFRTLDDCLRMAAYARGCRRAAVIGGGLLGLEAARGLLAHGLEVHVVHAPAYLMNAQVDATAGALLDQALRRLGIQTTLQAHTTGVLGEGEVTGLALRDGSTWDCQMVVLACGIRPHVDLARGAGLTVHRGVVVDDQMRTLEDPRVYAVGECAEHRGRLYGLVAPSWEQAQVVADHLTGARPEARYSGSKLSTRLKVVGVDVASMGEPEGHDGDEVVQYLEPARGIYKKLVVRDGRLAGAILLGDASAAATLVQTFDREAPVPEDRAELLFPHSAHAPAGSPDVADMPDDARVCVCNGVTKDEIVRCVRSGAQTTSAVSAATRAGTGCGTCRPLIAALIQRTQQSRQAQEAEHAQRAGEATEREAMLCPTR